MTGVDQGTEVSRYDSRMLRPRSRLVLAAAIVASLMAGCSGQTADPAAVSQGGNEVAGSRQPVGTTGDKEAAQATGSGHSSEPQRNFTTGLFDDEGAPTSSINFVANNYWNGYFEGTGITVYGGYDGYDHMQDGAILAIPITKSGGFDRPATRTLRGVGALSVTSSYRNLVILVNEQGTRFVFDLTSADLSPITSEQSALIAQATVLGARHRQAPYGSGWGTVAPRRIYNGGTPSGLVTDIEWQSWGSTRAIGRGQTSIYRPNGGYYKRPAEVIIRAQGLSNCPGSTRPAYTRLYYRNERKPGGEMGKQWRLWQPQNGNVCRKAFN